MVNADLRAKHRWTLLALMALGGEVTNPDLKEALGFSLVGQDRRLLNDLQLVASTEPKPYISHELTEAGWHWCVDQLSHGQPPEDAKIAGRAFYVVLRMVQRYLDQVDLTLPELCHKALANGSAPTDEAEPDLREHIRQTYHQISTQPGQWVSLTDLRSQLRTTDRTEVDDTLRELNRAREVHIVPESNQKALTARDRAAAVRIGGENSHLISIDER